MSEAESAPVVSTPIASQLSPYRVDEPTGKRSWCACGHSKTQPYCDGSHKTEAVGLHSIKVEFPEPKSVAWCGCRQTKTPPFCDGSHRNAG